MRTTRIRQKVKQYLLDKEQEQTTAAIFDHINNTMTWGVTMQQLGNVLAKDNDIKQVGEVKTKGAITGRYTMMTWSLRDDYWADNPPMNKEQIIGRIIDWLEEAGPGDYVARDIRKGLGNHIDLNSNVFQNIRDHAPEWLSVLPKKAPRGCILYRVEPRSS